MNFESACKLDWVAIGTWVLAGATFGLYRSTRSLVNATKSAISQQAQDAQTALERHSGDVRTAMRQQSDDLRADLAVRLHMMVEEKWDGERMEKHRAVLARKILDKANHDEITESVMDFFESFAILYRLGLIHKELAWNTFGFHASRWWTACKEYVFRERDRQREGNVPQSFTEFEWVANEFYEREAREEGKTRAAIEPSGERLEEFLRDEMTLHPEG